MANPEQQMQLVFIPSPGVGHLAAMVELADLLVRRRPALFISVLIITTPSTAATVTRYTDSLPASPRIDLLHLPNTDAPPAAGGDFAMIETQKPRVREAVSAVINRSRGGARLSGFVLDMFCTSLADVAGEFAVPSYIFFTSPASALGFVLHIQAAHDGEERFDATEFRGTELAVPSWASPVPRSAFPTNVTKKEWVQFLYRIARDIRGSRGILINTVREFESHAVDSLSSALKVYPVGPILNLKGGDTAAGGAAAEAIEWLDRQPESTVVFLCFGSMGAFPEAQVREIARGLEASGQRFLWSLRRPGQGGPRATPTDYENVGEVLPEGFADRTAEVGRVIGWAPQTSILAHRAVGGFVSHCGWNSTLESVWFEVPMATWPMYAEQKLNAFLLVKELEIATEIRMSYSSESGEIVTADEIERGVRQLMEKDRSREARLKRFSEDIKKALMDGGSSSSSIAEFFEDASNGAM
ncbi:unnamed protein product [Linum tenue]|uniref:Glycosyltransferase n=4 Tax=Linum tenue TaxID=586396 RepID=A0AAV0N3U0_9ROSI|nr:unnamed protein product [Linum tenue]